ncbi:MAG: hypothetical protein IKQ18_08410, partial [Clostridia bacterium]|nr:hypothetical protein [Clostridia bacterium]
MYRDRNGGAIYYTDIVNDGKQSGTINGGTISGCRAKNGGAVYVDGGKKFTISGGFIMDNSATLSGGGVATGSGAQLTFSAAPRITGNTCDAANDAPGKVCNVQLDFDSTTIINANKISNGARIGVYVPGDDTYVDGDNTSGNTTLYDKHGGEGDPFGQYIDSKDTSCLYIFTNDRNGLKGGRIAGLADTDHRIFWVESFSLEITNTVVSSVNTDKNEPFAFRVKLSGVARDGTAADTINSPADDKAKYGELYFVNGVAVKRVVKNGNNLVLEDLVLKDGETVIAQKLPDGLNYEIEELLTPGQKAVFIPEKGYTQNEQSVAIKGYIGENADNTSVEDSYKSYVEFKNLRPVSKITTRNNTQLYFLEMYDYEWFDNGKIPYSEARYMPTAYMTLEEAFTHANGKTLYTSSYNSASHRYEYEEYSTKTYHIEMLTDVTAKSMSSVKNDRTITLTTASKSAEMYPYYGYGSTATIGRGFNMNSMFKVENGSFILNNIDIDGKMPQANTEVGYTGGDGGIVYVTGSGELTVQSGASLMNSLSEGRGGAIYVADGGKLTVSGGTINLNVVDGTKGGEGAGIYLAQGSVMHISGKPYFGGKGVDAGGGINYSTGNICINA